jgi:hypothetical protein
MLDNGDWATRTLTRVQEGFTEIARRVGDQASNYQDLRNAHGYLANVRLLR